jgi:hypothetical protein
MTQKSLWKVLRIAVAFFISLSMIGLGGVELCEATVHIPANGLDDADFATAPGIAKLTGASQEDVQVLSTGGLPLKG